MKSLNRLGVVGVLVCLEILQSALDLRAQPAEDRIPAPVPAAEAVKDEVVAETVPAVAEHAEAKDVEIHWDRRRPEIVRFGTDVTIEEGEEVDEFVVIFGSGTINGKVRGDAVIIGGTAKVNGEIGGNLVVPLGSAELGPRARVRDNLVVVGGTLSADPDARVDGDREVISWEQIEHNLPPFAGAKNWIVHGLILARPLPHQAGWWWWVALGCAALYLLTNLIFNRPITASVGVLESRPVGSFFMGVLMFVLFVPVLLLLAATGIGVFIVPFVFCAAFVAFLFGKIAVYRLVGEQVGKQSGMDLIKRPIFALLVGIAIIYLVYMIPVIGFVVWGIVAPLGFGAATLAAFRAFRTEGSRSPNRPLVASPVPGSAPIAGPAAQPPVIGSVEAVAPAGDYSLLPRAGFWIRFVATFLDLLLIGTLATILHSPRFFLLIWVVYHIGMWSWKGTTIGGVVFGLRIVRRDGRPIDFAVALLRSLASFFSALVVFVGFFWAGWNREKQSWHDLIAGTIVIKVPKGVPLF